MIFSKAVDRIFCHISSIIYRTIISLLCIFIASRYEAIFPKFYVFTSIISYQIIAFTLFIKFQKFRTIRLFLDYAVIMFVLLTCDVPLSISFGILALPIVNSPNHTGDKRTCLPHALSALCFLILGYKKNINFDFYYSLPILAYATVGYIDIVKKRIVDLIDELYSATDDIFSGGLTNAKTDQEYNEILKKLNSFSTLNRFAKFKLIVSAKNNTDSLLVLKSSNYNTLIISDIIHDEITNGYKILDKIIIDNEEYDYCYFYKCNYDFYHFIIFEGKPIALQMIHSQILKR